MHIRSALGHWDFEIEILPALCWDFGRQRVCRTTGRVQRDNCPAWFLRNTSAWSWQLWKMAVLRRSWVNCHCIRLCSYASSIIIRHFDVYAWLSLMVSDLFRDGLDGRKVLCQTKKRSSHLPWDLTFQDHGSWVTNGFYLIIWISCIQHGGWPSLVWCHLVRISTGDDVCVCFSQLQLQDVASTGIHTWRCWTYLDPSLSLDAVIQHCSCLAVTILERDVLSSGRTGDLGHENQGAGGPPLNLYCNPTILNHPEAYDSYKSQ